MSQNFRFPGELPNVVRPLEKDLAKGISLGEIEDAPAKTFNSNIVVQPRCRAPIVIDNQPVVPVFRETLLPEPLYLVFNPVEYAVDPVALYRVSHVRKRPYLAPRDLLDFGLRTGKIAYSIGWNVAEAIDSLVLRKGIDPDTVFGDSHGDLDSRGPEGRRHKKIGSLARFHPHRISQEAGPGDSRKEATRDPSFGTDLSIPAPAPTRRRNLHIVGALDRGERRPRFNLERSHFLQCLRNSWQIGHNGLINDDIRMPFNPTILTL